MARKPKGLGKGLGSLIPKKISKNKSSSKFLKDNFSDFDTNEDNTKKILLIDIDNIKENPHQPRHDFDEEALAGLVESVKEHGIIQPLVVSLVDSVNGIYELIAGERRLRAAKQAGLSKVPVIVKEATDKEKLELAIIENIQRENLNPLEEALAYKKLMQEYNMTQDEVAQKLGKSRSVVANTIRLLNLPEVIKQALGEGLLTQGHARAILALDNAQKQLDLFDKIINLKLTVRDTEKEVKKITVKKHTRKVVTDPIVEDLKEQLQSFLGTKVKIKKGIKSGSIIIDFYSDEELSYIIQKIIDKDDF